MIRWFATLGCAGLMAFACLIEASAAPDPPTWMLKWGSAGTAPGQLNFPVGVATDELGNVYVVDQNNQRVQKFDRLGRFLTRWGSYGSGPGQFYFPCGIALDPSGNLFVVDGTNYRIQKFTGAGGIYFVRLSQGASRRVQRVVVVD